MIFRIVQKGVRTYMDSDSDGEPATAAIFKNSMSCYGYIKV